MKHVFAIANLALGAVACTPPNMNPPKVPHSFAGDGAMSASLRGAIPLKTNAYIGMPNAHDVAEQKASYFTKAVSNSASPMVKVFFCKEKPVWYSLNRLEPVEDLPE